MGAGGERTAESGGRRVEEGGERTAESRESGGGSRGEAATGEAVLEKAEHLPQTWQVRQEEGRRRREVKSEK